MAFSAKESASKGYDNSKDLSTPSHGAQSQHSGPWALSKHGLISLSNPSIKGASLPHFFRRGNRLGGEIEVKAGPWQPHKEGKTLESGGQPLGFGDQA